MECQPLYMRVQYHIRSVAIANAQVAIKKITQFLKPRFHISQTKQAL